VRRGVRVDEERGEAMLDEGVANGDGKRGAAPAGWQRGRDEGGGGVGERVGLPSWPSHYAQSLIKLGEMSKDSTMPARRTMRTQIITSSSFCPGISGATPTSSFSHLLPHPTPPHPTPTRAC
jgi:hypothetical protein